MNAESAARIVALRWSAEGKCHSCATHWPLWSYGELRDAIHIDHAASLLVLECLAEDGATHRGIRMRFGP
jgi:hypothetical protein